MLVGFDFRAYPCRALSRNTQPNLDYPRWGYLQLEYPRFGLCGTCIKWMIMVMLVDFDSWVCPYAEPRMDTHIRASIIRGRLIRDLIIRDSNHILIQMFTK